MKSYLRIYSVFIVLGAVLVAGCDYTVPSAITAIHYCGKIMKADGKPFTSGSVVFHFRYSANGVPFDKVSGAPLSDADGSASGEFCDTLHVQWIQGDQLDIKEIWAEVTDNAGTPYSLVEQSPDRKSPKDGSTTLEASGKYIMPALAASTSAKLLRSIQDVLGNRRQTRMAREGVSNKASKSLSEAVAMSELPSMSAGRASD